MSIKLGGSKSKTSSTNTSTSTSTTTPTVPEWASTLTQNVAGRIGELSRIDPQSLVAGVHPLQAMAGQGAGSLTGLADNFNAAGGLMAGAAQRGANGYQPSTWGGVELGGAATVGGESLLSNLDAYMSPYRRQVVDSALADFDYGAGQTRAQQDLDLAGSGAFGGSGAALTRSATEDALTRGRATTSSNLYNQMFQQGAALSAGDADRRQQASMANAQASNQFALERAQLGQQTGLANTAARNEAARYNAGAEEQALQRQMEAARGIADLSSGYEANQRANIATQAGLGQSFRDIEQQQRQAPITSTQQIVAMLNGLPISLFTGEQRTGTESGSSTGKSSGMYVEASHDFVKK